MTTKPILFSGPMVRALLEGRKTQTRRVVKDVPPQPAPDCHPSHEPKHAAPYLDAYCGARPTPQNPRGMQYDWHWWQVDDRPGVVAFRLPYAPGDLLWVREAFTLTQHDHPVYRADATDQSGKRWSSIAPGDPDGEVRWKPSIHMPRWASRLTLRVTDVRVQRVQEISAEDARDEGVNRRSTKVRQFDLFGADAATRDRIFLQACKWEFEDLWDSLNAPRGYGWDANPWVAAYTFEVIRQNVEEVAA